MSGIGRWSLGIGLGLLVVAVASMALNLVPVAVIVGIIGLVVLSMAVWDALNEWAERAELRRRGNKARRDWEQQVEQERQAREGR